MTVPPVTFDEIVNFAEHEKANGKRMSRLMTFIKNRTHCQADLLPYFYPHIHTTHYQETLSRWDSTKNVICLRTCLIKKGLHVGTLRVFDVENKKTLVILSETHHPLSIHVADMTAEIYEQCLAYKEHSGSKNAAKQPSTVLALD